MCYLVKSHRYPVDEFLFFSSRDRYFLTCDEFYFATFAFCIFFDKPKIDDERIMASEKTIRRQNFFVLFECSGRKNF